MFQNSLNKDMMPESHSLCIITPNKRSQKHFEQYYLAKATKGETPFILPKVFPLDEWLSYLYDRKIAVSPTSTVKTVLNESQAHHIWLNLLLSDERGVELLNISETIQLFKNAWDIIHLWGFPLKASFFNESIDCKFYFRLHNKFKQYCSRNNLITNCELYGLLDEASLSLANEFKHYQFFRFNEFHPALSKLQNTLENLGVTIKSVGDNDNNQEKRKHVFDTAKEELTAIAKWYQQNEKELSEKKIAVVFSDFSSIRNNVIDIFSKTLDPYFGEVNYLAYPLKFNVSGGRSIKEYSIYQALLAVLNLNNTLVSKPELKTILLSPWFFFEKLSEDLRIDLLKAIDYDFEDNTKSHSIINKIKLLISQSNDDEDYISSARQMLALFEEFHKKRKKLSFKEEISTWIQLCQDQLEHFGFLQSYNLDSENYQAASQWIKIKEKLLSLSIINKQQSFNAFINSLSYVIQQHNFQAESSQSNLYLYGLMEASGIEFDIIWFARCDDSRWPTKHCLHPYLPKDLQIELNSPHSSAEKELNYCKQLLESLEANCETFICSYHLKDKDLIRSESPLINDINHYKFKHSTVKQAHIDETISTDRIIDTLVPIEKDNNKVNISTISEVALCPARAFYKKRLHLEPIEQQALAYDNLEKGTHLHNILEDFWLQLKNSITLHGMPESSLHHLIDKLIDKHITEPSSLTYISKKHQPSKFIQAEKKRVKNILIKWIDLEKNRNNFDVIKTEFKLKSKIEDLNITIRIDRIDRVKDKITIIDYKTGFVDRINWLDERPDKPQLLLYILLLSKETDLKVSTISYARINKKNMGFYGISQDKDSLPGINNYQKQAGLKDIYSWQELQTLWLKFLKNLINEYESGLNEAKPKNKQICITCDYIDICRIKDRSEA